MCTTYQNLCGPEFFLSAPVQLPVLLEPRVPPDTTSVVVSAAAAGGGGARDPYVPSDRRAHGSGSPNHQLTPRSRGG